MPEDPDLRLYDTRIPYYDRTPDLRATRATLVKFLDATGTHLICPRRACKREGGCRDRDMRGLPFCWNHYRGMLRFLLCLVAKHHGADEAALAEDEPRMPQPFRGTSLFGALAAGGARIGDLERPAADGPDDWTWEAMPAMQALFRELLAEAGGDGSPGEDEG